MTSEEVAVERLDDTDANEIIAAALEKSGFTIDQLNEQAREGKFKSETARRTWFVISSLVEAA